MISSASSPERSARPDAVALSGSAVPRFPKLRPDCISTESAAFLRTQLDRQPAIRPEAIARGRELAADPAYPSLRIMRGIARQILASPDLSHDES